MDKRMNCWLHTPEQIDELDDGSIVVIGSAPECFGMQKLAGEWYIAGLPKPVPLENLDWHAFPARLVFTTSDD